MADINFDQNDLAVITASLTPKAIVLYQNADAAEFVVGQSDTVLAATASMEVSVSTITYKSTGTSGTGTSSVAVGYPSGSGNGDLIIFTGASKQFMNGFSNANFKRAGWAHDDAPYEYQVDAARRATNNNSLGTDIGPTRMEHQIRYLNSAASGSETFTTTGTVNFSAAANMHRFSKPSGQEWIVKSYGQWDNTTNAGPNTTNHQVDIRATTQYKVTNSVIKGIGNNPGVCTLLCTQGLEIWKSITGFEWKQLTYPFGADFPSRIRFGNGVFIMVGGSGKIGRSTDNGGSWTVTQPLGSAFTWTGVRYYNNRWIACGPGGRLATSDDDGQTWTQRTSGVSVTIYDVAWGDGYYVNDDYPEENHAAWNDGVGRWWYAADSWRMFKSDDNGNTWSEGVYQTSSPQWNQAFFTQWDPLAIIYDSATYQSFRAAGSNLGDYFDYGYYQNAINWGSASLSVDSGTWRPNYSGYSYGFLWFGSWISSFYGKFGYARDADRLLATNGWAVSQWYFASSLRNGIAIGSSEVTLLPTYGYNQRIEYSTTFQWLGKKFIKDFPEIPVGSGWDTIANLDSHKYFYRDGGTLSLIYGHDNGDVWTNEYTHLFQNEGRYDEGPSGNGFPDIRDGDLVVVSISVSDSNATLTNIRIRQSDNYTTGYETMKFTPFVDMGTVTSTSGDRCRVYSGYSYASGELSTHLWENWDYGTGSASHWMLMTPQIEVLFDATASSSAPIALGAYSIVLTVLRAQAFGVDTIIRGSLTADAEVRKVGITLGSPGSIYTAGMTVDAFVEKSTTPLYLGSYSVANEISAASIQDTVFSPSTGIPAGSLVVTMLAADNLSATTPTVTISDSAGGNTWNLLKFQGQNASAAAGCVADIHYSILTNAIPYGGTITASLSGSVACKGFIYLAFAGIGAAGLRSTAVSASGSSATPTVTSGTVNAGDLVVALASVENATLPSADSDTLNGSWANYIAVTGTGGNALTHIGLYAAYKLTTGAGAQTFNPATSPSTDWAECIGVFAKSSLAQTAAVLRPTATMSVTCTVNTALNTTAPLTSSASLTAAAEVVEGTAPVVSLVGVAKTVDMATAVHVVVLAAPLSAVANLTAVANIATIHTATVTRSVVASLTAVADVQHVLNTTAPLTATVTTVQTQGNVVNAQATLTAAFTSLLAGNYVYTGTNPTHPTDDPAPVIQHPEPLPGTQGWTQYSSTYGPTGRTGNLLELTNRHYQDAYIAATHWEEWPFPNGPGGFFGMGILGVYTMGARSSSITPLGNDRFLVTWTQENWVQYYLSWQGAGNPLEKVLMDVPLVLVATILDCSGDGDPVVVGTTRYDLPLDWRWYRNAFGQSAQPLGNGKVACTWAGFFNIPDNHALDHGSASYVVADSANLVCVIDASGNAPIFNWVKTFGGNWNGLQSYMNEIMIHEGNVLVTRFGYSGTQVAKFNGSNGALIGQSSTIPIRDASGGQSSCVYKGDTGVLYGDDGFSLRAFNINLNTLSYGSAYEVKYKGSPVNPTNKLYKSKQGADGKWYAGQTLADSGAYAVLKMDIVDGKLVIESIHRSDIANTGSYDETALTRGNAYRTSDYLETWVPTNYGYEYAYTLYTKQAFCPGARNPSVVGVANYMTDPTGQAPEHQHGPQLVAQIPPMGDAGEPARPMAWVSSPSSVDLSNWSHYFAPTKPIFLADMDCAEMSNGRILVVMAGAEDLLDAGTDGNGNGIYRIFAYIADPQNEPPPLKLAQRDDDKVAGAARIGYDSQNESTIRAGWVAW